jgi:hypothetical protein
MPNINSAVMTGLRMNIAVRFTALPLDTGENFALPQYLERGSERLSYSCGRIASRRRRARRALSGYNCRTILRMTWVSLADYQPESKVMPLFRKSFQSALRPILAGQSACR